MVLDYKDVLVSARNRQIRRHRRVVMLAVLGAALLALAFFVLINADSRRLKRIEDELLQERLADAENDLRQLKSSWFHPTAKRELRALQDLFQRHLSQGEAELKGIKPRDIPVSVSHGRFLEYFANHGLYRELSIYSAYLLGAGNDSARWYHALALMALLDFRAATAALNQLSPAFQAEYQKPIRILTAIGRELEKGRLDYIFSRRGQPLAGYDLKTGRTLSLVPGIDFTPFTESLRQGIRFFTLTLDVDIQQAVHRLLKNRRGSLLMLDLDDGSIRVAYSPAGGNAVFDQLYEPGSIIKIVTLLAYLRSRQKPLFPFHCPGWMTINGRFFYDALKHGDVANDQQALAVSCNLSFARMGLALGFPAMSDLLKRFFFNSPGFTDQGIFFRTGQFADIGGDAYRLANLVIGLKEIEISTFHAALIAALFAQKGTTREPFLIDSIKNVLHLGYYNHRQRRLEVISDDLSMMHVQRAMAGVVEDEAGTGRRARVDFVQTAVKTGTSGRKDLGLDAVIVGYFPVEKPKYALAFRLEGVGRAEFQGAAFLRDFLEVIYNHHDD